ncbi:MAG: hypothetical protein ACREFE_05040 [Limisphaerales bacterium]
MKLIKNARASKDSLEIKDLFEPIAPYFADAYNTLTSVVQSLALGFLGIEVSKNFFENSPSDLQISKWFIIARLLLIFFAICILWHRYITHNQFDAWRLDWVDTMIPLGFSLLEVFLILAVPKNLTQFSFWFTCISFWGIVAYLNAIRKHNSKHKCLKVKKLFQNHFGEKCGNIFFDEVTKFEESARNELIFSSLILIATTFLIHLKFFPEWLFLLMMFLILVKLLRHDLWKHLENADNLKEFWDELDKETSEVSQQPSVSTKP